MSGGLWFCLSDDVIDVSLPDYEEVRLKNSKAEESMQLVLKSEKYIRKK